MAKCGYCDAWYQLDELKRSDSGPETVSEEPKVHVPVPKNWNVKETEDYLVIEFPHRLDETHLNIGCSLIALCFCGLFIGVLIPLGSSFSLFGPLLVLTILVAMGLVIQLMMNLNKTSRTYKISVSKAGYLTVGNEGVTSSNWMLEAKEIKQLYCTELNSRLMVESNDQKSVVRRYDVNVLLKNDQSHVLVSDIRKKREALFLEYRIERYLDIENEPVLGEVGRN